MDEAGGGRDMNKAVYFLMVGAVVALYAFTALAGSAISIQWGDTSKPQIESGGYEFNAEHLKQYPKEKYKPGKNGKG